MSSSPAEGRSACRSPGARPRVGCGPRSSTPASPAPGRSPRACWRRPPRPSSARTRCAGLGLRSAERFEAFCAELADAAGRDPGLRRTGTLAVARDADEAEALERLLAYRIERGLAVERLRPSQARRLEPALAPTVRLALLAPDDHSVDPRMLVAALRDALDRAGVQRIAGRAERVTHDGERVTGLAPRGRPRAARRPGRRRHRAERARRARRRPGAPGEGAGAAASRPPRGRPRRAHDPRRRRVSRPARRRPLRARRDDGGAGLRPHADRGRRLRAAARHRRGRPRRARARRSRRCSPGCVPRRPTTCPRSARARSTGLHWAAGHFRNGVLLAPVTADLVAGALAGEELPAWAACCDPRRFAKALA